MQADLKHKECLSRTQVHVIAVDPHPPHVGLNILWRAYGKA